MGDGLSQPPLALQPCSGEDDDPLNDTDGSDDNAIPPAQALPTGPSALPCTVLLEVCERASARLSIDWPALINPADQEKDVYDGKLLGVPLGPRKQTPAVAPSMCETLLGKPARAQTWSLWTGG